MVPNNQPINNTSDDTNSRRKLKIGIIIGIIIALLIALCAGGYYYWRMQNNKSAAKSPTNQATTDSAIRSGTSFKQTGTLAGDKTTGFRLIYTKDGQPAVALLSFNSSSKCVISWEMSCEEALTKESFTAGDTAEVEGAVTGQSEGNSQVTVTKLTLLSKAGADTGSISSTSGSSDSNPGDEATPQTSNCSTNDYNMDDNSCASQTPEQVCGQIRSVYDNGEEQIHNSTFRNVCEFCSQFDTNGFLELRGTKMYSLGYMMGACK